MRETVCFAYYVDNNFVGWYGDSFGSICNYPKLVGNSKEQLATIQNSFLYKMRKINEVSFSSESHTPSDSLTVELFRAAVLTSEKTLKGRKVELRTVKCPYYDGPNPEFNHESYQKTISERREAMRAAGIFDYPAGTMPRMKAIEAFDKEHPEPKRNSWIYADSTLVEEWAKIEPTEFLTVFKYVHELKSNQNEMDDLGQEEAQDLEDGSTSEM